MVRIVVLFKSNMYKKYFRHISTICKLVKLTIYIFWGYPQRIFENLGKSTWSMKAMQRTESGIIANRYL